MALARGYAMACHRLAPVCHEMTCVCVTSGFISFCFCFSFKLTNVHSYMFRFVQEMERKWLICIHRGHPRVQFGRKSLPKLADFSLS